jgi:hypothetical protein
MENDDEWMQVGGETRVRIFNQIINNTGKNLKKQNFDKDKEVDDYINKLNANELNILKEIINKFNKNTMDISIQTIKKNLIDKIEKRNKRVEDAAKAAEKAKKAAEEDAKVKAAAPVAAKKAPVATASVATTPAPVQTVDLLNEIEKLLNSPPPAPGPGPGPAPAPASVPVAAPVAAPVPTLTPYAVVTINIQPDSPDTVPQKYTAYLATPKILLKNYQIGTQPLVKVDLKKLKACKYYLYDTQNTTYYYLPDTELSEPPPQILSSTADLLAQSE